MRVRVFSPLFFSLSFFRFDGTVRRMGGFFQYRGTSVTSCLLLSVASRKLGNRREIRNSKIIRKFRASLSE